MARYRNRPVEIDAVQYLALEPHPDGQFAAFGEQTDWLEIALRRGGAARQLGEHKVGAVFMFGGQLAVVTPGGNVVMLEPGDWVIRDAEGAVLPCDAARFAKVYEAIDG